RRAIRARSHGRGRLEHETSSQVVQAIERSRLRQKVCVRPNSWRPCILKTGMLHAPQDVDAPALDIRVLVAKALEWNAHFHLVAALYQTSLRLEEVVRV